MVVEIERRRVRERVVVEIERRRVRERVVVEIEGRRVRESGSRDREKEGERERVW